ncbi:MAG TPA: non-canonical purine NTP pyrophosphatase, RdgB/HAM1 family [Marinilabiliaceae bacterium]|mgnify:FL=1|nr:non-canonical purine NTP pyrophosphatase, RdgB/HAM1 family [Marinilabiliaceae bacterium]
MKILFASHNTHKISELRQLLPAGVELVSLADFNYLDEIEETGKDLMENAFIKARTVYSLFKLNTIADDTGLEVEALGGAPGVMSARYAGEGKRSEDNIRKLLKELDGVTNRKARFRTVISLIYNGKEYAFEGVINGTITDSPSGKEGFGYDPIFKPDGYNLSFAEMDSATKNSISHRGLAVRQLTNFINKL